MALLGPGREHGFARRTLSRLRMRVRRSGVLEATTLKVLTFAVVCLVVLAVLAAKIGNLSFFSHRVQYQADLANALGLQPAADVKIAGVTVGVVDGVHVDRAHAVVTFSVNQSVHLPTDTRVGLQWQNVIGNQYLYLYPGHAASNLRPGATIGLASDVSSASIGALLSSLGPLLGAIHPQQANAVVEALAGALDGNQAQISNLIDSAASVSHTVGSVGTQVGQVITNLDQVFGALARRSADIGTLIDNLQTVSQSLAANNSTLDRTVANLGTVAAEVATLVSSTHGTLTTAIDNLQSVSGMVQQHDTALANGLSGLGAGLAPYTEVTNYGQWFQVKSVYTCLASQTTCTYDDPTSPPAGSGLFGGPPVPGLPNPPAPIGGGSGTLGIAGAGGPGGGATSAAGPLSGAGALSALFGPLAEPSGSGGLP